MVCSWPKWSQRAVIRKVFITSQWAIEEKRGKTWASDWFVTWDEFFFFDQSHTEVYENWSPPGLLSTFERKLLDACSYIWTESANIGTNLSVFQLCRPRIGFLFLKIFFRLFFPPRQVVLPKISQSVPILKVFTVHFSEIWNCFLRWGLLSVTLHNP